MINTVIQGDCLEILKNIPDSSVDAVVTDPPFGINFKYTFGNDVAKNAEEYWKWFQPIYNEMIRVTKKGGFIAIWQSQLYFKHFWNWYGDGIHIYAGCKNFVQLRKTPINYAYDPIVMFYCNGDLPLRPKAKRNVDFFVANTAAIVSKPNRIERQHPCPRPLDLTEQIIDNFVIENGTVLDLFAGSGTTGIACKNLGRNFILIEKEKEYIDIINKRLSTL